MPVLLERLIIDTPADSLASDRAAAKALLYIFIAFILHYPLAVVNAILGNRFL